MKGITHDAKDGITFSPVCDGIVDDIVLLCRLFLASLLHIDHAFLYIALVDRAETLVEENLCGKEGEFEAQLFVVSVSQPVSCTEANL
jgi:hypothetical protein